MALERGAGARQLRVLVRELEQIVARCRGLRRGRRWPAPRRRADAASRSPPAAPAQTPRARSRRASASAAATAKTSPSRPRLSLRANRSSIRLTTPSARPSSTRPAVARPEQRAPAKTAPRRGAAAPRAATGSSAGSASGVMRTVPRGGTGGILRVHHHHAGIIEPEGRRAPMRGFLAHCSRSPIRNCSARSRRM